MANFQVISQAKFTNKSWKQRSGYSCFAGDVFCRLGVAELPRAMMAMPIAFLAEESEYSIVAVQGVQPGVNSFVSSDGKWQGSYIPASYRAYPFVLDNSESESEEILLCIDADSGHLLDDDTGEPFFNENLEPTKSLRDIAEFLSSIKSSIQVSSRLCKSLSEFGLLKPWELEPQLEPQTKQVGGLYCIDETALNELSPDAYAEVRAAGAIPIIYCQLLSMQRISVLAPLIKTRLEADSSIQHSELNFDGVDASGNINFENL